MCGCSEAVPKYAPYSAGISLIGVIIIIVALSLEELSIYDQSGVEGVCHYNQVEICMYYYVMHILNFLVHCLFCQLYLKSQILMYLQ